MEERKRLTEKLGKELAKKHNYFSICIMGETKCGGTVENIIFDADNLDGEISFEMGECIPSETEFKHSSDFKSKIKEIKEMKNRIKKIAKQNNISASALWDEWIYWSN